jgi:hypothetical protein
MKTIIRRDMMQTIGRGVAFGGLGLLAAVLTRRSAAPARRETPCSGGGRCGACPSLSGCGLPRGLSARVVRRDEAGGRL